MPQKFIYRNVVGQLSPSEIDERVGESDIPLHLEHTSVEDVSGDDFEADSISLVFPEHGGEQDGSFVWRAHRHNSPAMGDVFLEIKPDGSATLRFPTSPAAMRGH